MARPVNFANTPFSNSRYGDNSGARQLPHRLPTGTCNFTNLSIGGTAKCGCQRYWDRSEFSGKSTSEGATQEDVERTGWCMCEHHACFHEAGKDDEGLTQTPMPFQRQLSQERDASLQSTYQDVSKPSNIVSQRIFQTNYTSRGTEEEALTKSCRSHAEIGTLGADARNSLQNFTLQNDTLPPIPSQCLLPPNISSGGIVGKSLSFGSAKPPRGYKTDAGSINDWIPYPVQVGSLTESLTDVATPLSRYLDEAELRYDSIDTNLPEAVDTEKSHTSEAVCKPLSQEAGVPLPTMDCNGEPTSLVLRPTSDTDHSKMNFDANSITADLGRILPHMSDIHRHYAIKPTLKDTLQNHEDRLDHLENSTNSFLAVADSDKNCDCDCDLLSHKHENIECRMDKIEKALATKRYKGLGPIDDCNGSVISETSTAMTSTSHTEMYTRIDLRIEGLESRICTLDNSILPSASNPWEFEVIFLPYGIDLNRVWAPQDNISSQKSRHTGGTQDGMGSQFLTSSTSQRFFAKAATEHSWEHLLDQYGPAGTLYSPRVCGIDSIADKRLRSRGLVRTIEVKGPDAQHVQFAMFEAFDDLLHATVSGVGSTSKVQKRFRPYREALNASWIPLRKLHRDSRLRFLETSEMLTSTLWTPTFLAEISMQQSGKRRLYVTNKDSYLQHTPDGYSGWTWQTIRQLPRHIESSGSSASSDLDFHPGHSLRSNALTTYEPCWNWDEKLDGPVAHQIVTTQQLPTQHPSLSFRGPSISDSEESSSAISASSSAAPSPFPIRFRTPASESRGQPISPLTELHLSRPHRARTASMPATVPINFRPSSGNQNKRRITSFAHEHERGIYSPSSSPVKLSPNFFAVKRQRTRSPSRPRDTPRWSTDPPSPYIFEEEQEHKRGMTPFAYATPHSNAPYIDNDMRPKSNGGEDWPGDGDGSLTDEFETNFNHNEDYVSDTSRAHHTEDDDPWEGVKDEPSDGEATEDDEDDGSLEARALSDEYDEDALSDISSTPSEYPSTQPLAMYPGNRGTFEIHVDDEK